MLASVPWCVFFFSFSFASLVRKMAGAIRAPARNPTEWTECVPKWSIFVGNTQTHTGTHAQFIQFMFFSLCRLLVPVYALRSESAGFFRRAKPSKAAALCKLLRAKAFVIIVCLCVFFFVILQHAHSLANTNTHSLSLSLAHSCFVCCCGCFPSHWAKAELMGS